ncbi:MFS transporter, partial [Kingella kingae]|uniref:MFS transporter n=1 Tax=Kingella kingae TaxID=504 RepID=UPI00254E5B14
PVLSAALFGLAIGAVSFGPVADKIGRKVVLTFSVFLFSAMCVASAYAQDLTQLTILRFITGLGLGAAMPNAVTLLTEFCPAQKRATIVNTMYCGFPIGAAAGGFFASWLIPEFGWCTALFWCGALPLILSVIMLFILPRSPSYLVVKKQPAEQIRKILKRINPAANLDNATFVVNEKKGAQQSKNPMAMVMGSHFRAGSILLWASYFLGLIIFYAMINWMPVIFKEAQMPVDLGPKISGLFALGGLGAIANGYLMDKFNGNKLIGFMSFMTAISVAFIGWSIGQGLSLLIAVVLIAGVFQNTAQSSLPALAAKFYPTECRTTGLAWMLG